MKPLSAERNTQFDFMLVYQPDSVNENKLLYQVAKFNFTSYLVRDFDIAIDNDDYLHRMRVSGFRSYDEALEYSHSLLSQQQILRLMGKARPFIDYKKFYDIHFAPIKPSMLPLLNNPEDIVTEPQEQEEQTEEEILPQGGVSIPVDEPKPAQQVGVTIPVDEPKPTQPLNKETVKTAPVNNNTQLKNNTRPQNNNAVPRKKVAPTQKKQASAPKKPMPAPKKQTFDIESEDYELDGF